MDARNLNAFKKAIKKPGKLFYAKKSPLSQRGIVLQMASSWEEYFEEAVLLCSSPVLVFPLKQHC